MQISNVLLVYTVLILIFIPTISISVSSHDNSTPIWLIDWPYRQEIKLPIQTNTSYAKFQPIDIRITFENLCWTINEYETSIRVCYLKDEQWFEIDSQIYNLNFIDTDLIQECSLVFLIPECADGNESYYIFYDNTRKSNPDYVDHLSIEDTFYSRPIIAGISAEAKYYGIKEDGYYVYGVGQEGKLLDRSFSQIVVKQKKEREEIDILDSDQIASFAFSYYYGNKEDEESSSDQLFVSKEIIVDGNLMVEFGIKSESKKKDIVTTVIYKYYYSPIEQKRLCVRVKHELLEEAVVNGKENIDGRFGMMASFKSRNPAVKKLNVGDIFPYLNFYDEDGIIKEYQMNLNPESKAREWIISYKDDADLGKEGWIAYGEGDDGKAISIIFSSIEDIIKSGDGERDGIQLKVAEKEYFDFLNAEVDYASINFGRNSFEKGYSHDLRIPEGLVVEFDAELFVSEKGGYKAIRNEAKMYQELVEHRHLYEDSAFEMEPKKYSLTVITHLGGTRLTFPWISNITNLRFPVIWIELYQDGYLISSGIAEKSFINRYKAQKIFPEIVEGNYLIKVFWKLDNSTKFFKGAKTIVIDEDKKIHILCSWERKIRLKFFDQNNQGIEGINTYLLNNEEYLFDTNSTDIDGKTILKAPFNPKDPYTLKAIYKGINVYEGELRKSYIKLNVNLNIELNNLTIEIRDSHDLLPGVEITPILIKNTANGDIQLIPEEIDSGKFSFKGIPSGKYKLQITYANFVDEKLLILPEDGNFVKIKFSGVFNLVIDLFDSRANPLIEKDIQFKILRNGITTLESKEKIFSLPPAVYFLEAYNDGDLVGITEVELTNNRNIKLVTTVSSILPEIILGIILIFMLILIILSFKRILELNSLLKFLAISVLIISLVQPWWALSGLNNNQRAERTAQIFINPQVMIESTSFEGITSYDIAEMPELFIAFLGNVVIVVYSICVLFCLSFISYKLRKKQYSIFINLVGIILIVAIISMFYVGVSKVTEVSVGEVQGEGLLSIYIHNTVIMQSSWGFSIGFYLVLVSAILAVISLSLELRSHLIKQKK